MKGTLHKIEQGWIVRYLIDASSNIGGVGRYKKELFVHPDYVKYYFLDEDAEGKEVEFEIVTECCTPEGQVKRYIDCKGCDKKPSYAKLVEKLGNEDVSKLDHNKDMTPAEQLKSIADKLKNKVGNDGFMFDVGSTYPPDVDKLGNEDVPKLGNDVEKLAEEYDNETASKSGIKSFIAGWNKCKETLYTEEDMDNYAEYCTTHVLTARVGHPYLSVKEWKSLKQPKKD